MMYYLFSIYLIFVLDISSLSFKERHCYNIVQLCICGTRESSL